MLLTSTVSVYFSGLFAHCGILLKEDTVAVPLIKMHNKKTNIFTFRGLLVSRLSLTFGWC